MSRLVLLLALGGCDLVFDLVRDIPPPVCGPFAAPEEVVFDPRLINAHDLSVDASGTRGLVHATFTVGTKTWTGPHAVARDGTGMWGPDLARDKPVLDGLDGAHQIADGTLFGWVDKIGTSRTPEVHQYELKTQPTTAWSQIGGAVTRDLSVSTHIGNAIDLVGGGGAVQKFHVQITIGDLPPNNLAIYELPPASTDWQATNQAGPLLQATEPAIDPQMAVLTSDHEILVYAAKLDDAPESRLFASRRARNLYNPGVELIIDGVAPDGDLTEPWINGDCTELYFRRADTTWRATAVDDAASRR